MSTRMGKPVDRQPPGWCRVAKMIITTARAPLSTQLDTRPPGVRRRVPQGRRRSAALVAPDLHLEASVVPWTLARSRLARASRVGQPHEIVTQLCSEYTAARLARLIRVAAPEAASTGTEAETIIERALETLR